MNGVQLAASFPYSRHRFPKFFVRDVQVALRLLDVGVTEDQLDIANVDAVRQEAAGAFVPQIVPVQIDLLQLLAVHSSPRLRALCVVPVCNQEERFPRGLEAVLEFSNSHTISP